MFNTGALWEEISYANQYWQTMSLENSSFLHKVVLLQTKAGRGMAGGAGSVAGRGVVGRE